MKDKMLRSLMAFLRTWALAVAMVTGAVVYLLFHYVDALAPVKADALHASAWLMPVCLFFMLFFTFCKVNPRDLVWRRWFWPLMLTQLAGCMLMVAALLLWPSMPPRLICEGVMIAFICPTGAATPVIVGKLGGSEASATGYCLLSTIVAAVAIPFFFPLVEPNVGQSFLEQVARILSRVIPVLIMPLAVAWLLRWAMPRVHDWVRRTFQGASFWIWSFNLVLVIGDSMRHIFNSRHPALIIAGLIGAGFVACCIQFFIGRRIGGKDGDAVTPGQSLGQKNNVFAVWVAGTYLPAATSLVPSSYIVWQNVFNSWELQQLRKRQRRGN